MILLNAVQNSQELIKQMQEKIDNSEELISQMQDKVISLHEQELSFLNDTIANIYAVVGIAVGVLSLVATGFLTWITYANNQAKQKMNDAQQVIQQAEVAMEEFSKEKIALEKSRQELENYRKETEDYRKETERKFTELTELVNSREIDNLKEMTKILNIRHQITNIIENTKRIVMSGYDEMQLIKDIGNLTEYRDIEGLFNNFRGEFELLKREVLKPVSDLRQAEELIARCVISEEKANLVVTKLHLFANHLVEIRRNEKQRDSTVQP